MVSTRTKLVAALMLAAQLSACGGDDDATSVVGTHSPAAPTSPPTTAPTSLPSATPRPPTPVPTSTSTAPLPTVTTTAAAPTSTPTLPPPSPTPTEATALLAPPAPEDGFQLMMTDFDVPIGGETEVCRLVFLPNDALIEVDRFEIAMTPGSHHIVVWSYNGARADQFPTGLFASPACVVPRPDDSMNTFNLAASALPYTRIEYPAGIGMHLKAHHPVLLNAHYANATGGALRPTVYVNLYYAKQPVVHPIESLTAINYKIFVPPGASRTTTARFTMPFDAYFLGVTSHMHKRGDLFTARLAAGEVEDPFGRITTLEGDAAGNDPSRRPAPGDFYRSHQWENPTVLVYDPPQLYRAGTTIEFDCTQHNDKEVPLSFGPLSNDEMCILTGTYYRAEGAPPPETRIPGCLPQTGQITCYAEPLAPVAPGEAVCGNGRREGGEECDLGEANGGGGCTDACVLDLAQGTRLGTRSFPIVFSGPNAGTTDFINSVTRSSAVDARKGVVSSGPLQLTAGALRADGSAPVTQDAEVRIGLATLGGIGSTSVRIAPTTVGGTLHCRGGKGIDLSSTLDNADRMAQTNQVQLAVGLGSDGGPGSAMLLLNASVVVASGPPEGCLTRDWSHDLLYPMPFTTGTTTGTITNAEGIAGFNLVMSATGENFDCARWNESDAPGVLQALTFLSPNTTGAYTGDVIAQLTLAGRDTAVGARRARRRSQCRPGWQWVSAREEATSNVDHRLIRSPTTPAIAITTGSGTLRA